MSVNLTINGTTYAYPEQGDDDWGVEATDWAVGVTNGMLQKAGGTFQLLAEVDFGTGFGLSSLYYKSRTANGASTGIVRLARTDIITWRNEANDADLSLSVNSSNDILFNGVSLTGIAAVTDTATIDLTLTGNTLSADIVALSISNALISASAAIAFSKMAALTASRALQSNASGVVEVSTTTSTELGYVSGVTSAIQTQIDSKQATGNYITALTGDVVATGPGSVASVIQSGVITNAMINASAAIAYSKLAALTASRALVSDGSGFVSAATTTATEIGYVNGVTSAIQTQLDAKQLRSVLTTKGDLYAATASDTVARVGVGANGTVLTANSAVATGVEWSAVVASLGIVSAQAADYVILDNDGIFLVAMTTGGTNRTVTLPTASANTNRIIAIKKVDSGVGIVSVLPEGAETIDGGTSFVLFAINQEVMVQSNGSTWYVLNNYKANKLPTVQVFTSGSGTYTTPIGVKYIQTEIVAGGGGGASGGGTAAAGTSGNSSTFGPMEAFGGIGGGFDNTRGIGGAATLGSGPIGFAIQGNAGSPGATNIGTASFTPSGGTGGAGPWGGAGIGGYGAAVGTAGAANSGAGGGGGSGNAAAGPPGGGGGAGGYIKAIINSPASTYGYSVGTGGAGAAGSAAGQAGGSGLIVVTEFY